MQDAAAFVNIFITSPIQLKLASFSVTDIFAKGAKGGRAPLPHPNG
jgi:hypothetical protein